MGQKQSFLGLACKNERCGRWSSNLVRVHEILNFVALLRMRGGVFVSEPTLGKRTSAFSWLLGKKVGSMDNRVLRLSLTE